MAADIESYDGNAHPGAGSGEQPESTQEAPEEKEQKRAVKASKKRLPIVGVGASAGGLRAFELFFDSLPANPGMAFVLVQHLDPHHESELAQILQNRTTMPVAQVTDRQKVEANHVYVIPPGRGLTIEEGTLYLSEQEEPQRQQAPIDHFFRSLAEDQGENAVCVIFSGTGNDGSLGLKHIKERNGVVLVQEPEDAEYDGMPRHAVKTGLVDLVAPVDELAQRLVEYGQSTERVTFPGAGGMLAEEDADLLQRLFTHMRSKTGTDFSLYKRTTILRRLQRRMQITQKTDLQAYLGFLRSDPQEVQHLTKDFLISVTNFFRDEDAWLVLAQEVIPKLLSEKQDDGQIRVWVPGCATGEEAYSLAMLLVEEAGKQDVAPSMQIFATDLDEDALSFGRRGRYPRAIAADVSAERLRRFFTIEANGYRVRSELQELVLFAPHDLIRDAPFARMDLISCRNLLIYLRPDVQKRVFQLFRYALGDGGYLFLGSSESASGAREFFEPVHRQQHLYRARAGKQPLPHLPLSSLPQRLAPALGRDGNGQRAKERSPSLGDLHRELMLRRYAPPSVLVNSDYEIRYKFGDTGRYLRHREGEPSLNLLENVDSSLRAALRAGLYTVFRQSKAVRDRRVRLDIDGHPETIQLRIEAAPRDEEQGEALALVVFEPAPMPDEAVAVPAPGAGDHQGMVQKLEAELKEVYHRLQTTVEEYETSNEELKSSNEELQSMNEELRSTSEELETSREELRSTNEELISLNQELQNKVEELKEANSDLENLMEATSIAILFLDRRLRLKRYTPEATDLFNIIPSDIGRPFGHLSHKIDHGSLPDLAENVLHTLEKVEEKVYCKDGRWLLMQMRPYRTVDDKIDGVVVTLVDISAQVEAEEDARRRAAQQSIVARLGLAALGGMAPEELMEMAVQRVANTLDVEYTKVLQVLPEREELQLVAGAGWQEGLVGRATVDAGVDSQAGYTLQSREPIIVQEMATEKRFTGPSLLTDHGVVSGMSVVIEGPERPFGVLGAHSREARRFSQQDASFLQAVANVIGVSIERQQTADELRASQKRLAVAIEASGAGVYEHAVPVDASLYHSPRWAEMLGYELHELPRGAPFMDWLFERVHPEDVERLERVYGDFIDGRIGRYDVEVRLRHKSGNWKWVRGFSHALERDEQGRVRRLAGMMFDIDEHKKALADRERLLETIGQERARLETVLKQMPAGVIIAEAPSGKLLLGNDRVREIWRRPFQEAGNIAEYERYPGLHPDGTPLRSQEWPLARAISSGEVVTGEEIAIERGDGTEGIISCSAAPIHDQAGNIIAGVVIFQDVTERKAAEEERQQLLQQLQALNETLEERVQQRTKALRRRTEQLRAMASALAVAEQRERERISQILHDDLQQLLYAAQMQATMIDVELKENGNEALRQQLRELEQLNDSALNVTRSLTVELSPPVLEGEGLAEALTWLGNHMESVYGLRIRLNLEEGAAPANSDLRELLFQMVRELLFNVVKHAAVDEARVTLRSQGEHCLIEVSDEGRGFDLDTLSEEKAGSIGYGIRSIRERIELFEGTMEIETAPDSGTHVILSIPQSPSEG